MADGEDKPKPGAAHEDPQQKPCAQETPSTDKQDGPKEPARDLDKQPCLPCLTLILWNPPAWVPSENATTGPRHTLHPSPFYGAQGQVNSYLPSPLCRARYRKVWHEHRKDLKRRRLRTRRKRQQRVPPLNLNCSGARRTRAY
ncbi:E1^E4 [Camelus dromedarius papillomavirus 1]|uniref:E1^E4 n=1 Tax=Camelus dromedarius papillomavirus 1 TaxID=996650 RepID=F2YGH0_9PAPI|nr:E1^E4 [Camelus dromedarius papillomavirus 1]ADZ53053.1 E1^E4 [Camelus dromedarius papillomavirus 1]